MLPSTKTPLYSPLNIKWEGQDSPFANRKGLGGCPLCLRCFPH